MSIIGTVVAQEPEVVTSTSDVEVRDAEAKAEAELAAEVVELWGRHQKATTTHKATRAKLKVIREELGRKLAEIKPLICRVGRRGGEWGKFLEQHAIAKATADRLVKKYGQGGGQGENVLNEEVPVVTEVEKFRASVITKGNRLLPHQYDKYHFLVGLAEGFGLLERDGDLIEEPEAPEDDVEPDDDELGDGLFMHSGGSSDEVLATDHEEPAIGEVDESPAIISGKQKRQIKL
jgi:hypothetical protein